MRTVMLASVRTYARRYVAAAVAVVAGVSFVVVTAAASSATKNGLLADVATTYRGADVVVRGLDATDTQRGLEALRTVGPSAVNAQAIVPLARGGRTLDDEALIASVASEASLRWQHLREGRFPTAGDEAVLSADAAKKERLHIGDRLVLGAGRDSLQVTVVGVTTHSTASPAGVFLTWPGMRALGGSVFVDDVVVGGGASADQVRAALPRRAEVQSADEFLRQQAAEVTRNVDVVAAMLLVFAGIALFVSVLVIANTFTILLAQRLRDFALLRCVGATRRQVMRSVRQEALVVGVVASTVGVLVGLGLGRLLVAVLGRVAPALPTGDVEVGWRWLVGAWLVGVLVTLVASVFPARRSTRIEPLQALRPLGAVDLRSGAGKLRIALAAVLVVVGSGLLALAMASGQLLAMVAGGFVSFLGVLVLGPVLVPACVRLAGRLTGRVLGVPGRLAAANAVRNPRRTAATAASLLVGTTLITGMVTGMATIRGSIATEMDAEYPVDVSLTSAQGLPAAALDRVRATDGVERAVALRGTTADLRQGGRGLGELNVLEAPTDRGVLRGTTDLTHPPAGTAYVSDGAIGPLGLDVGRPVVLRTARGEVRLKPEVVAGLGKTVVVAPSALERLDPDATTRAVWARATDGADADDIASSLEPLASSSRADIAGGLGNRNYVDLQLDVMMYAVVGLLGIALVIALIGIGNTLGLSVLERRREHAMLRALGLTRGQLRATLAVEAVLLAAVTSVIGVALGVVYAVVGVQTVLSKALGETGVSLHLPVAQLVLVVAVAAVAGLAACVLPARNAARVSPAAGLALE